MNIKVVNNIIEVTSPINLNKDEVSLISSRINNGETVFGEYNPQGDGGRVSHVISSIDDNKIVFRTIATYWGKVLKDNINNELEYSYDVNSNTVNILQH